MNNAIISSYMTRACGKYFNHFPVRDKQEETTSFYDVVTEKSESVVWQYAKKHPGEAAHVKSQVQAGIDVRRRNRVENVSTENMTMDEYKSFITMLLNSIPFDSTRIYDEEIISISEKGWEQMKNDTDYEAWVLGYTVENRSVRNPFFGLPGASGSFYVEKFGASIEEHVGQSIGRTGPGSNTKSTKNEKSWWDKRCERMTEVIEERAEQAQKKAKADSRLAYEDYINNRLAGQYRLHNFLTEEVQEGQNILNMPVFHSTDVAAFMAAAYSNILNKPGKSGKF